MGLVTKQAEFLLDVCQLIQFATQLGFEVTGGELFRTTEQQAIYYKSGRSKTMDSNHLKRLAVDLNFFKSGQLIYDRAVLAEIGDYWERLRAGNSWGGNWKSFKDIPHFERRL